MSDHDAHDSVGGAAENDTHPNADAAHNNIDGAAENGTRPNVDKVSHNHDDSSHNVYKSPSGATEVDSNDLAEENLSKDKTGSSEVDDNTTADSDSPRGPPCVSCSRLDLSASRFIIDSAPRHIANEVRNSYLRRNLPAAAPNSYHVSTTFRLGTLSEIIQRASRCSFCALVHRGFAQNVPDAPEKLTGSAAAKAAIDPVLCASWEIDGRARGRDDTMRSRTRRLHLKWSEEVLDDAYVVYSPPNDYMRPSSDAPSVYKDDDLFLGRPIDSAGKNRALMKSWYDLCRDKHEGPCRSGMDLPAPFLNMANSSYFGVIDVCNLQLTSLPRKGQSYEPYVALSYVWGKGERYKTLKSNVRNHGTHGGLETIMHELPQAIQDAIALVPTLGLRYLWVDSLCIVQDSSRSWKLNAFNMDLIYGHAALTICAADGHDSTEGLRAMHRKKRNATQHTAEVEPGLRLMLTRPPESAIRTSTWASRAWTFQERLLSPRVLIFVDGRVYFQCRSTGMSEDFVADKAGAGWSLDLVDAPLQILRQVSNKPFWVYSKAVELYSCRSLTKKEDILAAFSGTCRMLEARMSGPFVFGLPTSHFDLALLWQPVKPALRRRISSEEAAKLSESERTFPSWAWCGWKDSPMLYDSEFLDGVFRDTRAWLLKHTWIRWNVRDGYGNLRPLWNKNECHSNPFTEARWRGYSTSIEVNEEKKYRQFLQLQESGAGTVVYQDSRIRSWDDGTPISEQSDESRSDEARSHSRHVQLYTKVQDPDAGYENAYDLFGRALIDDRVDFPSLVREGANRPFEKSLPEFPYRVVQKPYKPSMESIEHPLKPILQFHTLYMRLNLVSDTDSDITKLKPELKRYSIVDDNGDWCGSIRLDSSWFSRQRACSRLRHEFIAISEAMRFSDEECPTWTYYIPKERAESEWDLFYVLLIQYKGDVWERIGVGKVFKEAFSQAKFEEVVLG